MSYPLIAREGWLMVLIALGLAVVVTIGIGTLWSLPFWLIFALVLQFFRDPPREIPREPGLVLSPAHGKVVSIGEVDDPYLKRRAQRVSVFMNAFCVHSNRIPAAGVVRGRWYYPGRFFNTSLDKSSVQNERNAVWVCTGDGQNLVTVQVAGLLARRILCYVEKGDPVERGERYGFIRFGSRLDVYLPENAEISVRLGQWVKGGSDVIARLRSPDDLEGISEATIQEA